MDLLYLYGDKERSLPLSTVSKVVWGQKTVSGHSLYAIIAWQVTRSESRILWSQQRAGGILPSFLHVRAGLGIGDRK